MNIKIICVGRLKEKFYKDGCAEYLKRMSRYCDISIVEVEDERAPENLSAKQKLDVLASEGARIKKAMRGTYSVALAINGKAYDSMEFAAMFTELENLGRSSMDIVIGGSLGLSLDILESVDLRISFSRMTFPHNLMRLILLEQIYRAYKIKSNEPYHK